MPDNQNVSIWDNPIYAWQQQLASGANLAKNLNWQTLLGLTLGTGIGHWLGDKFYNWWELQKQKNKNPPEVNSAAQNAAIRDYLLPLGEFDLGWKPQYQFPTAKGALDEYFERQRRNVTTPWQQSYLKNFSLTQSPTATPPVPATPTTTIPAPPQTPIPQVSPTVTQALYNPKQIYDAWRYNHLNNQPTVGKPF